jgi:hypothetical protein
MSELSGFEPGMGIWRIRAKKNARAVEIKVDYDFTRIRFTIDPADLRKFLDRHFPKEEEL